MNVLSDHDVQKKYVYETSLWKALESPLNGRHTHFTVQEFVNVNPRIGWRLCDTEYSSMSSIAMLCNRKWNQAIKTVLEVMLCKSAVLLDGLSFPKALSYNPDLLEKNTNATQTYNGYFKTSQSVLFHTVTQM